MFSSGQNISIRRLPQAATPSESGLAPRVEASIRFVRNWAEHGRFAANDDVVLRPGSSAGEKVEQPFRVSRGDRDIKGPREARGNSSWREEREASIRATGARSAARNQARNQRAEENARQLENDLRAIGRDRPPVMQALQNLDTASLAQHGISFSPAMVSPQSVASALGVDIAPPTWLPAELADAYFAAWQQVLDEKLAVYSQNPLTVLGLVEPQKSYGNFGNPEQLKQWFEFEAAPILQRFAAKATEYRAGECFVSAAEQDVLRSAFGAPKFQVSATWRDALHGADADLTPSSLEAIERKTAEHKKFIEAAELMRRPDESVFEWAFRVQQVEAQRAFAKVASEYKLSGALGAKMSGGGSDGSVGVAQKQAPELTNEEKAKTIAAAEELFAIQNALGTLQVEMRAALAVPQNISPIDVAAWLERVDALIVRMEVLPVQNQPRCFDPLLGMLPALRNHLLALRMNLDAWRDNPDDAEDILNDLDAVVGLTIEDKNGLGVETPVAPGAIDSLRQFIMDDAGWGAPVSVERLSDGSVLVTWRREVSQELSPFEVQDPKHQVRLANIGAAVLRDEQTTDGWELAIRITGEYRSPVDALRNVWGMDVPELKDLSSALEVLLQLQHLSQGALNRLIDYNRGFNSSLGSAIPNRASAGPSFAELSSDLVNLAEHLSQIGDPAVRDQAQDLFARLLVLVENWQQRSSSASSALTAYRGLLDGIDEAIHIQAELQALLSPSGETAQQIADRLRLQYFPPIERQHSVQPPAASAMGSAVLQDYAGDYRQFLGRFTEIMAQVRKLNDAFTAGPAFDADAETESEYAARELGAVLTSLQTLSAVAKVLTVVQADERRMMGEIAKIEDATTRVDVAEQHEELLRVLKPLLVAMAQLKRTGANDAANYAAVNRALDKVMPQLERIERALGDIQAAAQGQAVRSFDPEQMTGTALLSWRRAEQMQQRGAYQHALNFYNIVLSELENSNDIAGAAFVRARIAEVENKMEP